VSSEGGEVTQRFAVCLASPISGATHIIGVRRFFASWGLFMHALTIRYTKCERPEARKQKVKTSDIPVHLRFASTREQKDRMKQAATPQRRRKGDSFIIVAQSVVV